MKNLLQIEKTEINLGLKREYRFLHISDTHIAYIDESSSELDIQDNQRSHNQWDKLKLEFAEQFCEHCDEKYNVEAHLLFEALTEYALEQKMDALIMSGDIMDRVTDSNIRYLKKHLNSYPIKTVYCPGNHATHDEHGNHRNMYERFKGLIDNPEIDVTELEELKIVTIDNGTKNITQNQINRFRQELDTDKKIILVVHAPLKLGEFGEVMGKKLENYFLMGAEGDGENAHELLRIVKENDERLIAVLAGHIHGAVQHPVTDKLVQYTASSGLIGYGREIIIK